MKIHRIPLDPDDAEIRIIREENHDPVARVEDFLQVLARDLRTFAQHVMQGTPIPEILQTLNRPVELAERMLARLKRAWQMFINGEYDRVIMAI